jgi:hypothetical protein
MPRISDEQAEQTGRFWVYRLFDEQGRLLYLGKTGDSMLRRLQRHARDNDPWWPKVDHTRTLCTPCDSRRAMEAEWNRRQTLKRKPMVNRHRPGIDKPLGPVAPRPFKDTSTPPDLSKSQPLKRSHHKALPDAELRQAERELGMPHGSAFYNDAGEIDWHPGAFD